MGKMCSYNKSQQFIGSYIFFCPAYYIVHGALDRYYIMTAAQINFSNIFSPLFKLCALDAQGGCLFCYRVVRPARPTFLFFFPIITII